MLVIDDMQEINSGTVIYFGQEFPILDVNVIPSQYSDPSNLKFNWTAVAMTAFDLDLEIKFENPLEVSAQILPDYLEIIFRCPYMFVSKDQQSLADSH